MPERKGSIVGGPNVASVGTHGGIPKSDAGRERTVVDRSSKSAISDALELSVPDRGRHPYFDADIRITGRRQRGCDATERGHIGENLTVRSGVSAWRYRLSGRDRSFR